ncbi:hypothetical protein [Neolewinella antarctica]|uniref:Photosystem I assembly protein Ycf4 n=1 Tax=Neolewinella antarctica TaxID=442734 RepID=A0ABX0XBV1_9BACT|nr:hypothetical protein [Neolewinella antarctica]NJC26756.1 hypothetical protein [Neolewinella antarctica]
MANKIYQEKQRFHDWLVIALLALATVGLLYGAASYFWSIRASLSYSLISLTLALGLGYAIYWLTSLRSKLTITDRTIKFKIKGQLEATKKIAWEDVASCTIVKTPAIAKWDRPKATLTDEKFYSLSGRNGLMITTKTGSNYFIGCKDISGLQAALNGEEAIWEVIMGE